MPCLSRRKGRGPLFSDVTIHHIYRCFKLLPYFHNPVMRIAGGKIRACFPPYFHMDPLAGTLFHMDFKRMSLMYFTSSKTTLPFSTAPSRLKSQTYPILFLFRWPRIYIKKSILYVRASPCSVYFSVVDLNRVVLRDIRLPRPASALSFSTPRPGVIHSPILISRFPRRHLWRSTALHRVSYEFIRWRNCNIDGAQHRYFACIGPWFSSTTRSRLLSTARSSPGFMMLEHMLKMNFGSLTWT